MHWEIIGIESSSVHNSDGGKEDEDNNSSNHICDSEEGIDQRTLKIAGDDSPIKSDGDLIC